MKIVLSTFHSNKIISWSYPMEVNTIKAKQCIPLQNYNFTVITDLLVFYY